jgi:hypothetical protein
MAARLSFKDPPPRTLGDDLESFVHVLLWLVCRYAPNDMEDYRRAIFLERFDKSHGQSKADMLRGGRALIADLELKSDHLTILLEKLLDGCQYRYTKLGRREQRAPGELEEFKHHQAQLESHSWLMDLLSDALKAEEWKAFRDPAKDQEVAPLFQRELWRRRKSDCLEYDARQEPEVAPLSQRGGAGRDSPPLLNQVDDWKLVVYKLVLFTSYLLLLNDQGTT